jgi:DNA adenine methylase
MERHFRPFLRWAGSKKQILPILSTYWDRSLFSRYVEPFVGSASLFFHITPDKALLGDINPNLILTYHYIKNDYLSVVKNLKTYSPTKEEYYRIRETNLENLDMASRAANFIYLNRYCFNGLYRTNRFGIFNVPYGAGRSGQIPSEEAIRNCSICLQNAELFSGDFEGVLIQAKLGDFVYLDPPFAIKSKRVFNQYNPSIFDHDSLIRLKHWLSRLDKLGVTFLVSYGESEEAYYLSEGFSTKKVSVRRSISGFSESRKKTTELLISNR